MLNTMGKPSKNCDVLRIAADDHIKLLKFYAVEGEGIKGVLL